MKTDPIAPILHKKHIEAINRRMPLIFQHIQQCVQRYTNLIKLTINTILRNGKDMVILDQWLGLKKET